MRTAAATGPERHTSFTASTAGANDQFGYSVSINGDYAIVGAHYEDTAADNAGAAYIFHRNEDGADNWGEVTILTASDPDIDDEFGSSVSISGDYAIVGAHYEDSGGTDAGAAYLFHRNEGGADSWGEVDKLVASDPDIYDAFGKSVSISGDHAIVGAPFEGGASTGATYIFESDLAP